MDPEKLFFIDKKIVRQDRIISMIFSWVIAALLILIERGVVDTYNFSYPVFWVSLVIFIVLGILQISWAYTKTKVLIYNLIYAVSGAFISIFIVGFLSPYVFLGWLMLIINSTIYFRVAYWYGICGIFVASSLVWVIKEHNTLTQGDVVTVITSMLFVILINIFISTVWALLNRSVKRLNDTQENEKLVSERLGSLINSMVDGVVATDEQGKIVIYNGAALNILDLNIDLHGKTFAEAGKFVDENNQDVDINKIIMECKSQMINRDFRLKYPDGSLINLYLSVSPVHLGFGRKGAEGFVILFRDITREKSLEEERDEFISVVSHELRTPIAIAEGEVGNAEFLIKKTVDDKSVKEALKQAHDQILFLSNMINDLSTLSRAERGVLEVNVEDVDCQELINELKADYTPEAEKKGLKLEVTMYSSVKRLSSSKLYVREILQNFITNAIKYTQEGTVTIAVKPYEKGVLFQVSDTGIGIGKGDQEKVFDKFFRSEDYRTRENNGTGLGLYVTMKLAHLINAKIDLESELNKGSTFYIKIPNLK